MPPLAGPACEGDFAISTDGADSGHRIVMLWLDNEAQLNIIQAEKEEGAVRTTVSPLLVLIPSCHRLLVLLTSFINHKINRDPGQCNIL